MEDKVHTTKSFQVFQYAILNATNEEATIKLIQNLPKESAMRVMTVSDFR
jgi:hypothetical protein